MGGGEPLHVGALSCYVGEYLDMLIFSSYFGVKCLLFFANFWE